MSASRRASRRPRSLVTTSPPAPGGEGDDAVTGLEATATDDQLRARQTAGHGMSPPGVQLGHVGPAPGEHGRVGARLDVARPVLHHGVEAVVAGGGRADAVVVGVEGEGGADVA